MKCKTDSKHNLQSNATSQKRIFELSKKIPKIAKKLQKIPNISDDVVASKQVALEPPNAAQTRKFAFLHKKSTNSAAIDRTEWQHAQLTSCPSLLLKSLLQENDTRR
jgi:hypothetical protein